MIEIVTALLGMVSVSIFVAHACEVFSRGPDAGSRLLRARLPGVPGLLFQASPLPGEHQRPGKLDPEDWRPTLAAAKIG